MLPPPQPQAPSITRYDLFSDPDFTPSLSTTRAGRFTAATQLVYHNTTPFEVVRVTQDGGHGKLLVPYFDKPLSFIHAAHENPELSLIFSLDVDEFLDCRDFLDAVTGHSAAIGAAMAPPKRYAKHAELKVPRRVVGSNLLGVEDCQALSGGKGGGAAAGGEGGGEGCSYVDIFGLQYRWQKFNKIGARPWAVPDISIHGSETPGWPLHELPSNFSSINMPSWDCAVEHLNPTYFGPKIKTRSLPRVYRGARGPRHWGE